APPMVAPSVGAPSTLPAVVTLPKSFPSTSSLPTPPLLTPISTTSQRSSSSEKKEIGQVLGGDSKLTAATLTNRVGGVGTSASKAKGTATKLIIKDSTSSIPTPQPKVVAIPQPRATAHLEK